MLGRLKTAHATAARWHHDRLVGGGDAARRRSSGAILGDDGPDHDAAGDPVRDHPHHAGDPRCDPGPILIDRRSSTGRSAASARVIARRSKTRSSASRTKSGTRFSWSPRDGTTIQRSIPTASRPRCRKRCSWQSWLRFQGLERVRMVRPGYAIEYDHVDPRELDPTLQSRRLHGPVPGRPDQRHDRATKRRRGRGWSRVSNAALAAERGRAGGVRPRRRLSRGDDRRSGDPGHHRALSDVYLAGRIPPDPAGGQCRPTADRQGRGIGVCGRCPQGSPWHQDGCPGRREVVGKVALDHPERGRAVTTWRSSTMATVARRSSYWPIRRSGGPRLSGGSLQLGAIETSIAGHLEIDAKYDVYLKRQVADVDAFRRTRRDLTGIDYALVPGYSPTKRVRNWEAARPRTVGQAGRLDGITPAALGIFWRPSAPRFT